MKRIVLPLLALLVPYAVRAQPRASERGTTSQVINGTRVTIDYARPVARGRDNLFGGVVHFGEHWTPGANWATTLETDGPIRLNGHDVPAGTYSVWMEPQDGEWTVFLNREWRLYHDAPVPRDRDFVSFTVSPVEGAHMESLAWYFPAVDAGRAELRMHWGTTVVPLEIETDPFTWADPPAAERAAYVGTYAFDTNDPTTGGPMRVAISVLEENGRLVGRWGNAPIALIPQGGGVFRIGFLRRGELFDVGDEMTLRVLTSNGASTGAELLWEGTVFGVGQKR